MEPVSGILRAPWRAGSRSARGQFRAVGDDGTIRFQGSSPSAKARCFRNRLAWNGVPTIEYGESAGGSPSRHRSPTSHTSRLRRYTQRASQEGRSLPRRPTFHFFAFVTKPPADLRCAPTATWTTSNLDPTRRPVLRRLARSRLPAGRHHGEKRRRCRAGLTTARQARAAVLPAVWWR